MGNSLKQMYESFSPKYHYDPALAAHEYNQEKLRKALIKTLTDAEDKEDARMLMEILGYLPYKTFTRLNNKTTNLGVTSKTNGYLESIGRL